MSTEGYGCEESGPAEPGGYQRISFLTILQSDMTLVCGIRSASPAGE